MWKSEGLFAEAKQNHGLSRAKYRGRAKVQIQAYLSAIVQNLKRLVFLLLYWLVAGWSRRQGNQCHPQADLSKGRLFQHAPSPFSDSEKTTPFLTHQYCLIKRCRWGFWDASDTG